MAAEETGMKGRQIINIILQRMLMPLLLCGLSVPQAQAIKDQFKMNINISGTVIANGKCTFDEKDALNTVDFGQLNYSGRTGTFVDIGKRQLLRTGMTCSGDMSGARMTFYNRLIISHGAVYYDGHVLLPVIRENAYPRDEGLGIRLWVDGAIMDIGKSFSVDMAHQPKLELEFVDIGGRERGILSGHHSSAGTLVLDFL